MNRSKYPADNSLPGTLFREETYLPLRSGDARQDPTGTPVSDANPASSPRSAENPESKSILQTLSELSHPSGFTQNPTDGTDEGLNKHAREYEDEFLGISAGNRHNEDGPLAGFADSEQEAESSGIQQVQRKKRGPNKAPRKIIEISGVRESQPITVIFRDRLRRAMALRGINQSQLADKTGSDRSTLSQLLTGDQDRLPRTDRLVLFSLALDVRLDWLLGLSEQVQDDICFLESSDGFEVRDEYDALMLLWNENRSLRLRHVPLTLPSFAKTAFVRNYEFRNDPMVIARAKGGKPRMEALDLVDHEMELAIPLQAFDIFAGAWGPWQGLDSETRQTQLQRLITIFAVNYPRIRGHVFDQTTYYPTPMTICGREKAVIRAGNRFLVLRNLEQIMECTGYFDGLIRNCVVQPHEFVAYLEGTLRDIR